MPAAILVATPHTGFGELLRISLEDNGQYHVRLAHSAAEAYDFAKRARFQLAIIDAAVEDQPFVALCTDLLQTQKGLRLLVIPPGNDPNHPALGGLMPHGYLNRPFYQPDLLDTVSRLLTERRSEPLGTPAVDCDLPGWLEESLTLRAYLQDELAATEAVAGIVGQNKPEPGSGMLQASAGQLSEDTAQEISSVVFRYWNRTEKGDLMRYIRLASDKRDFLIYATQISGDMVLIMVYQPNAPLSQIRPQARAIAQNLATRPPENNLQMTHPSPLSEKKGSGDLLIESAADELPAADDLSPLAAEEDLEINLLALLGAVPPPDPEVAPSASSSVDPNELFAGWESEWEPEQAPAQEPAAAAEPPAPPEQVYEPPPAASQPESATPIEVLPASPAGEPPVVDEMPAVDELPAAGILLDNEQAQPAADEPPAAEQPLPEDEPPILPAPLYQPALQRQPVPISDADFDNLWNFLPESEPPAEQEPPSATDFAAWEEITPPEVAESAAPSARTAADATPALPAAAVEPPARSGSSLEDTQPTWLRSAAQNAARGETALPETTVPGPLPLPDWLLVDAQPSNPGQTQPSHPTPTAEDLPEVPVSPVDPTLGQTSLYYTCVILPNLPQNYLVGDLADRLAQWLRQLCQAFGWRLHGLAVRPEYLQWSVQVMPAVSPGSLVRIIRQRTSYFIFEQFPQYRHGENTEDFWAPGYLVISGDQPPSMQLVRDYIAQTRKRQGIKSA